jgi:glycosyltransferase involved in cell wall biosynthesis
MAARKVMMPLVKRIADVVMSTGLKVAQDHPGAVEFGDRLILFYPPVNVQKFQFDPAKRAAARAELGLSDSDFVVGNVSNVNLQKGHDLFVRTATLLHRTNPDVKFVILGATYSNHAEYTNALWRAAAEGGLTLGKDLIVRDPGARVAELEQAFDVFLLTSKPNSEGIPTVVEEAMSLGLPVVTTDVGSLRETVEDGVTGMVVPPLDPQSLLHATLRLSGDRALRERMGLAARKKAVEKFDAQVCAGEFVRAYNIAMDYRRHRGEGAAKRNGLAPSSSPEAGGSA